MAEPSTASTNPIHLRRAENTERFVAFTFAAADMIIEVEPTGQITYAAGAFRARFGAQPESFIGRPIHALVNPADHAAVDMALALLDAKGRLPPLIVRLAVRQTPKFALAGLALAPLGCPARFCLTLAQPPTELNDGASISPEAFKQMGVTRVRANAPCDLGFIELADPGSLSSETVQHALTAIAPDSVASELAPGRFGVLGAEGSAQLPEVLKMLEDSLRSSAGATVTTQRLALPAEGLTTMQAARALGRALITFARAGRHGLEDAGFGGGLAGYVNKAAKHSNALRRAIKERRFELLFQPVVSLTYRQLHHYEALLRPMQMKCCQLSSPQEFVLLAETLGLASELDLAVAELACAAASRAPVPIAFNSSAQSVQDPVFRDQLLALLSSSPNSRAGRLMLEMTETAEVDDLPEAARTVEALHDINVPFCLDDFGAGTADVRVLRALPADTVKLDGSFVPGVASGGRERGFVAGIIEIARAAGANIVAERVETEAEAKALLAVGATYGQGWLYGKAAPLPAATTTTASRRSGERESWG
jgi:EAL domain-containing protein (putative c-di-GMP-specific phosphodiesterase class I)